MVDQYDKEAGLIHVLVERHNTQRLPRAMSLKEKVERGELLTDFDVNFITEISSGMNQIIPLIRHRPECQKMATEMLNLCTEIAEKALLNERQQ
ncbi:MAG: hypothetical protein OEY78_04385 [Gammaproteobacteria bacterium]|nr:hypothetical protein [Gammaproteobacteria bacterium]